MSISSDEVNFLVYRYLQENGFAHAAFTFAYESLVIKSSAAQTEIPPGALITFLQKGLEYIAIEEHIQEDGTVQEFDNNYSLLSPIICEAIAVRDDRKPRTLGTRAGEGATTSDDAMAMDETAVVETKRPQPGSCTTFESQGSKCLQLKGHQGEVFMCVWNPVRRQIASGSADGVCRLWGLWDLTPEKWVTGESGEMTLKSSIMPHCVEEGEKMKDVTSVTWSPNGNQLATGCYDGMARIWDNTGGLQVQLTEHTGPVFSLKWSKTGDYILSGSYDRRAIVWSPTTGQMVRSYMLHEGPVLDVDWRDGDVFATCSSDKLIYVCSVTQPADSDYLKKFSGHQDEVNAVCWSPSGKYLASCSDDCTAKVWTIENGLTHNLLGHTKEVFTLRWTLTGPGTANPDLPLYLCTASFDGTVKVWDGDTGALVHDLVGQQQPVYSLAPSPDGRWLASGSLGGTISIWSVARGGEPVKTVQGQGDTFDLSWSADGALLSACFSSGSLLVLDTSDLVNAPLK